MILALVFGLACSVQAHPHAESAPHEILLRAQAGNAHMWALEQHLLSLSPEELADARLGARELTTACPYNGATLQLMGTLIEQVPHDSATRPGVDSMARVLELLDLDPGAHSIDATSARLEGVEAQVEALTEAQSKRIEAANQVLTLYTPDARWPPKVSFLEWRDQLTYEGHTDLVDMISLQTMQRC